MDSGWNHAVLHNEDQYMYHIVKFSRIHIVAMNNYVIHSRDRINVFLNWYGLKEFVLGIWFSYKKIVVLFQLSLVIEKYEENSKELHILFLFALSISANAIETDP